MSTSAAFRGVLQHSPESFLYSYVWDHMVNDFQHLNSENNANVLDLEQMSNWGFGKFAQI